MIKLEIRPDLVIEHDVDRLKIYSSRKNKIHCLKELKKILKVDKIIFDVDCNWNIDPDNNQFDIAF